MTEIRVVIGLFRSNAIVFDQAELLGGIQSKSETGGLAAVVVYAVVPAVQQETTQGGLAVECILRSHPEMEVGDGAGKKQTARVVPVVLGFNNLSARVRNELSDVDWQTLARRRGTGKHGGGRRRDGRGSFPRLHLTAQLRKLFLQRVDAAG